MKWVPTIFDVRTIVAGSWYSIDSIDVDNTLQDIPTCTFCHVFLRTWNAFTGVRPVRAGRSQPYWQRYCSKQRDLAFLGCCISTSTIFWCCCGCSRLYRLIENTSGLDHLDPLLPSILDSNSTSTFLSMISVHARLTWRTLRTMLRMKIRKRFGPWRTLAEESPRPPIPKLATCCCSCLVSEVLS